MIPGEPSVTDSPVSWLPHKIMSCFRRVRIRQEKERGYGVRVIGPKELMHKTIGLSRHGCSNSLTKNVRHGLGSLLSIGLVLTFLVSYAIPLFAGTATLTWNPNTDAVAGYKIYFGRGPRNYGTPIDVGNVTTYTISGLGPGMYFFAVTAYNGVRVESGFSNEVAKLLTVTTPANHCDVNADGIVNALDLQMLINALLSGTALSNADFNRDGRVDVLELQTLNNVILGSGNCPP